jgi:FKBP-type peptidyl-prolyl cis-trans isomerase
MRTAVAVLVAAGLAAGVAFASLADPEKKEPPTAQPVANPVSPEAPVPPPPPQAIPVPDGPVVKKQELEGGLILEDIKIGDGYEVKPGGAVVAFYHGTLKSDGTKFDSAFERGEPIAFPLSGVIQGWQKGVPGMKIGGIRRLTIPSAMGYGEAGAGSTIPPNSDLVFVIQLVDALQIEDVKVGEGEAATSQCVAVTTHVIKNDKGEEVEKATAENMYIWFPGEHQGIQFGLEGMKPGGKRIIKVPKEMNVSPPQMMSTRTQKVPVTIELELKALRNLPQRGGR